MKKIAIVLAVLIVVVGIGLYFVYSNLGAILKAGIERIGSATLGVKVTVEKVEIDPAAGTGAITGLTVANPAGFSPGQAFTLGRVALSLDPTSLTRDPITVRELAVEKPRIAYEHGPNGSNLDALVANAKRQSGGAGGAATEKKDAKPERKLVVERLVFRDGVVAASHAQLQGRNVEAKLPSLELKDLGKAKGGATPAELAEEVVSAVTREATRAALGDINAAIERLRGTAREQIQNLQQQLPGALRGILGGEQKK
ncbi:MAG: hypothetical protein FJX46_13460 [Alphaproteobacteria bacterium]|nr:hypothetical protein [Alphaproteobacteria bacterium]